jgi:hypothetical protein
MKSASSPGRTKWSGHRTGPQLMIRIEHHKTGEIVDHPLGERDVKFYEEAEQVAIGHPDDPARESQAFPVSARCNTRVQRMGAKLGVDRRTGSRAVNAPDAAEQLRLADREAPAGSNRQAASAQAGQQTATDVQNAASNQMFPPAIGSALLNLLRPFAR